MDAFFSSILITLQRYQKFKIVYYEMRKNLILH